MTLIEMVPNSLTQKLMTMTTRDAVTINNYFRPFFTTFSPTTQWSKPWIVTALFFHSFSVIWICEAVFYTDYGNNIIFG